MRAFKRSRKGTSMVLGTLMIIVVVFASGFLFFNFVMSNVDFMKTTFDTEMKKLILDSFSANATHIVAFVRNTASKAVEFTLAYVNNMVATLQEGKATISPLSVGVATIIGNFAEGKTYTVKLTNIFNTAITFTATV